MCGKWNSVTRPTFTPSIYMQARSAINRPVHIRIWPDHAWLQFIWFITEDLLMCGRWNLVTRTTITPSIYMWARSAINRPVHIRIWPDHNWSQFIWLITHDLLMCGKWNFVTWPAYTWRVYTWARSALNRPAHSRIWADHNWSQFILYITDDLLMRGTWTFVRMFVITVLVYLWVRSVINRHAHISNWPDHAWS